MAANNPGRVAPRSQAKTLSWLVLFASVAISLISLLSAELPVRIAGLAVAGLGGVVGCWLAWREAARIRREAEQSATDDTRRAGELLHRERQRHQDVLTTLDRRVKGLTASLWELRTQNAGLEQSISTLRGNNESLRVELALATALSSEADAEVLTLPRRATGTGDAVPGVDLWNDEHSPTVVDLQAIAAPFVDDAVRREFA